MKKIILRLDLNIPIDYQNNKILETERIDAVIPEIKTLSKKNKILILSHLGKGGENETLKPIEKYLRKKLDKKENENVEILENTRWQKGETAKIGSKEFVETSKYFSSLGDEYIDDAFSAMHRSHSSIVGIPKIFKKEGKKTKLGDLAKKEINAISKTIKLSKNPKNNTLVIISGIKISTKLPLIKKFLNDNSKIFVGGGIANQIFKSVLNKDIGKSITEENFALSDKDKKILAKNIKNKNILLPIDAILEDGSLGNIDNLSKDNNIHDIGPATFAILKPEIQKSKNIIMNGPLGKYEEGFISGTVAILKEIKKNKGNILIGGGDTLFFTKKLKIKSEKNIFVSMAGGAMLDFIANDGKLPGIEALK